MSKRIKITISGSYQPDETDYLGEDPLTVDRASYDNKEVSVAELTDWLFDDLTVTFEYVD